MSAGFGTDIWCTDTLKPGVLARGATLVAQAAFGRLITARGTLRGGEEESRYGLDIAGYVGAVGDAAALLALPALIPPELLKDERIASCRAEAALSTNANGTSIVIKVFATLQDETSNFTLTLGVDSVSAELLGLTT